MNIAEIILLESFVLFLFGMFRCEFDSWRDRPPVINGFAIQVPYLIDIRNQKIYELPPDNINDCLLKQQLKQESE